MDADGKGYASRADVRGLSMEQLKAMAGVTDADPANTEEYEHVVFDVDQIR